MVCEVPEAVLGCSALFMSAAGGQAWSSGDFITGGYPYLHGTEGAQRGCVGSHRRITVAEPSVPSVALLFPLSTSFLHVVGKAMSMVSSMFNFRRAVGTGGACLFFQIENLLF